MNKTLKQLLNSLPEKEVLSGNYKVTTYGQAKSFKTEGDMYEYITGHRSKPIDDSEKAES